MITAFDKLLQMEKKNHSERLVGSDWDMAHRMIGTWYIVYLGHGMIIRIIPIKHQAEFASEEMV